MTQMTRTELPGASVVPTAALAELTEGYLKLRRAYAEAASRATSDAELQTWQHRAVRMRRFWELLDQRDLAEVLDGIAALHVEQQAASSGIAAQIVSASTTFTSS